VPFGAFARAMSGAPMISDDEREALTRARNILSRLSPSSPPNAEIASDLRKAWKIVTEAMSPSMSSDAALINARHDAATALSYVTGSLDRGMLTRECIDKASRAVAALLAG
jgi:hypothetical protein